MGIGSLTTAALTLGAEFDLRNVLEGKWPSSSVSIALAAILLLRLSKTTSASPQGIVPV